MPGRSGSPRGCLPTRWRSPHSTGRSTSPILHLSADTEVTFLLTSGGHNAGIVSPPDHPRRSYQIGTHREGDRHLDPDTWQRVTPTHQGSWWPAWQAWLEKHSTDRVPPPTMGAADGGLPPIADAPGSYVHES